MSRVAVYGAGLLLLLAFAAQVLAAEVNWPRMADSADGVPIAYEVQGSGEPTLVFIHGWSGDGRYWRGQLPHFAQRHRVVTVDLAGHGHSGQGREAYTLPAFGEDVKAVLDDLEVEQAILVGHSMGGPVSVEAAHLMPERVIGIIGVDTFHDVAADVSEEQRDELLEPLQQDFAPAARQFVASMFSDGTDATLRDWVVQDMAAASPEVAISAMQEMLSRHADGEAAQQFAALTFPVVAINADLWPTDIDANRQLLPEFDAVIMEDSDHFLHMAKPAAFNRELERMIGTPP
ncbi:Pimeloyl-ACP methyl ester carboxylesterase [Franzmannia pantelleriensis]|uniref:Pimeloyl-ACP methyl ester carboxylesterase n=1 Tax=Franzmannia pantelleriensis TaxID=48727 RepID=A0A1G9UIW8_9GAMM|nr:alpha/beta hydrolase [Halomonas pantelleriensis]SDM59890.1 Pimeloyl-ACP methyl ester carboxylesterase [Halomonas pantelleriensis]